MYSHAQSLKNVVVVVVLFSVIFLLLINIQKLPTKYTMHFKLRPYIIADSVNMNIQGTKQLWFS